MDNMEIKTFSSYEDLSRTAAQETFDAIKHGLTNDNKFVLGLATGATPVAMYRILIQLLSESTLDLSQFYTFNLDEYVGLTRDNPRSYYAEMMEQFWKPLKDNNPTFNLDHGNIPNGETFDTEIECNTYEEIIKQVGGIDLQILGLGTNGHIAFNEPGSAGDSRTRVVAIDEETRKVNAEKFFDGDISKVPTQAITMGIGTILEAKNISLLVSGESKREIFDKLKNTTEPTADNPSTFLRNHPRVTVYTDIA